MLRSFFAVLLALFSLALRAQTPAVQPRITAPVDDSSRVTLDGTAPAIARAEFDRGAVSPATEMTSVRMVLRRSAAQQAALDRYQAELLDAGSPNYHRWLTPQQFGKLYGPADADLDAVVAWLQARGLTVAPVAPGRTSIEFSGNVSQIESALHTSIHTYAAFGIAFLANATDPQIPSSLAPVISGIAGLNTLRPRPHFTRGSLGTLDPQTHRLVPAGAQSGGVHPELTTGSSGSERVYLVPADASTIYNTPVPFLNARGSVSGVGYNGTGVVIGIAGDSVIDPGPVDMYYSRFLGAGRQPQITNVDNTTFTGNADEAYLDTEIAGGVAPGASIHYYTANHLFDAIDQAINDNAVDILSVSFGECELNLTSAGNQYVNADWEQAAAQGIAVTVSTGDSGSAACDDPNSETSASGGMAVSGLASTPYNIAVGGTDFGGIAAQSAFSTYVGTTNGNLYGSVQGYIPEWTWNDSTTANTTISKDVPATDSKGKTSIWAGAGGVSTCATNTASAGGTSCTGGYKRPAWQRGPGSFSAEGNRDVPDVSLMAGDGDDNAAWLVCTEDTFTSNGATVTANCADSGNGSFYFYGYGGTSTAAPAFAGVLAIVQNKTGGRLGQAGQQLYDLFNSANASQIFHDTTVGNIAVPCSSSPTLSTNCVKDGAGSYFLSGYNTATGYDLATGMGSVDVTQLVQNWGSPAAHPSPAMTVTPSMTWVTTLESFTVTVAVASANGLTTPTGTVSLSGGGYSALQDLNGGSCTFTVPAGAVTGGGNIFTAIYNGEKTDPNYGESSSTFVVNVTQVNPTGFTAVPSLQSVQSNQQFTVSGTVSGAGPMPTGTVQVFAGSYFSARQPLNANGGYTVTVPANVLDPTTSGALVVSYSGDRIYWSANTAASVVVTTGPGFTLSATDVVLTSGAATGNTSMVTLTPNGGYTGTVALSATITTPPDGAVNLPSLSVGNVVLSGSAAQTATVTVSTQSNVSASLRGAFSWGAAGGAVAMACLFMFPLGRRRSLHLFCGVALACVAVATGCGGGGGASASTGTGTGSGGGNPQKETATVSVSPGKTSIEPGDALPVAVHVTGGKGTPTGTVTVASGNYTSNGTRLSAGVASIQIPPYALKANGSSGITASYSGDTAYAEASGTATVMVGAGGTTPGYYTVTVTGIDANGISASTTFALTVN